MLGRHYPAPSIGVPMFFNWVSPIVPNVYNEMLSYYETLTVLVEKVNAVISNIDNLAQCIVDACMGYTDEKFEEVSRRIAALEREHEENIAALQQEISDLKDLLYQKENNLYQYIDRQDDLVRGYTNTKVGELLDYVQEQDLDIRTTIANLQGSLNTRIDNEVADLNSLIDLTKATLQEKQRQESERLDKRIDGVKQDLNSAILSLNNKYLDMNNEIIDLGNRLEKYREALNGQLSFMEDELKEYIDSVVSTIDNVYAINPMTLKREPLNDVLRQLWNTLRWGRITALDYQKAQIQAKEYERAEVTAQQYDVEGRFAVGLFPWFYLHMRSPYTGQMDTYENIINWLASLHADAIKVQEFDDLALTCQAFDDKMILVRDFDFSGAKLLKPVTP